ncbi:MAG: hydrogenase iron-sulfur subunit [Deltaproteobacteria bacterium]|nr:hydrogenase iron-sulfur subunit [Deltaproteobacteria bacterium]
MLLNVRELQFLFARQPQSDAGLALATHFQDKEGIMEGKREFKKSGLLESIWLFIEKFLNQAVATEYNPFYYLGAISVFFLWIILVTGIYLFLFYDISAHGAYLSVQQLTINQWYLGGVMRSLHRYSSDGLIITMLLHAARCFTLDRYKHWRWLAWVSGVAIAWIIWIGGIFGYWMVWDERAKLVATLSAHMLENIPIFGLPLSLNFARIENLTDQLFYIILFIHFSTIFFLFILIMVHITRITKAVINPPRAVAYGLIIALLALSFIKPATSAPPAELARLVEAVPFDWFYLFIFPLFNYMSAPFLWAFIVSVTLIIAAVPWLSGKKKNPPVKVTYENCTGCELCMEDCPYQAILMRPRTDGMPYPLEAVVIDKRCASCGICVGSCDYKALNLPDITEDSVKAEVKRLVAELKESAVTEPKVMIFACAKGAWINNIADGRGGITGYEWARVVTLPCIGMLQPSMLAIPMEKGLDGVFIASCKQGDCHYRRGNEWLSGRLAGFRPPVVKRSVDRSKVKLAYLSAVEEQGFLNEITVFKDALKSRRS